MSGVAPAVNPRGGGWGPPAGDRPDPTAMASHSRPNSLSSASPSGDSASSALALALSACVRYLAILSANVFVIDQLPAAAHVTGHPHARGGDKSCAWSLTELWRHPHRLHSR